MQSRLATGINQWESRERFMRGFPARLNAVAIVGFLVSAAVIDSLTSLNAGEERQMCRRHKRR